MMFELNGRRALVTGASGAIGGAIVRAIHRQGGTVALSGTKVQALEGLASELGSRAYVTPADLGDKEAVEKLVPAAEAALGGEIDILVNNAGMTRDMLFARMGDDDWQKVLEVNLTAAFRLSRAVLRGMMRRRAGRIVSIASVVGVIGNPGQANYSASKAGLMGMTRSLAAEIASRNVTVNCVAPGFTASAMTDVLNDKQKAAIMERVPARRLGTPEEVAAAVVFLASDEAAYVTGQTIHVNGGMAMI
jgi:3-oxoacyl-[acyl-carrier protein] reductase